MSEQPTIHTCHDKCKRPMCVMRRERDQARAIAKYWQEQYGHFNPEHEWQALPWQKEGRPAVSDAPKTDALRKVVIKAYKEDELTGYGMGDILAALANIETLERERDDARERLNGLCQHFGADGVVDLTVKLLRLERERDNALSDAKQADTDSIRALAERNEARAQLALERALADRLAVELESWAAIAGDYTPMDADKALAAWKEARND